MPKSRKKPLEVRILNPAGGCGWTSAKRAIKLIAAGRARPRQDVGENVIEMIEANAGHQAALANAAGSVKQKARHSPKPLEVIERDASEQPTSEYSTFGRYPMFPDDFGRRRAA
jgi:hypothetical protein